MSHYKARELVLQIVIAQPHLFQPAHARARYEYIGLGQQLIEEGAVVGFLQIERDALLAAVAEIVYRVFVLGVRRAAGPAEGADGVAGRGRFHFYHARALRTQISPGAGRRPISRKFDDKKILKWLFHIYLFPNPVPGIFMLSRAGLVLKSCLYYIDAANSCTGILCTNSQSYL